MKTRKPATSAPLDIPRTWRPSDGPPPPAPSLRRPDLDPVDRWWTPMSVEPEGWPEHSVSISQHDDPLRDESGRGERFMRDLIAMLDERRAALGAGLGTEPDERPE